MSVAINRPTLRAITMWANLIVEVPPRHECPVTQVSNDEVEIAFEHLLRTLGKNYVATFFLNIERTRWLEVISDGDVRYLRALVQLARGRHAMNSAHNIAVKKQKARDDASEKARDEANQAFISRHNRLQGIVNDDEMERAKADANEMTRDDNAEQTFIESGGRRRNSSGKFVK